MSSDKDRKIEGSLFVHGNIYLTGEINQGELTASSNSRKAVEAVTQVLALNPPEGSGTVGTATPGTVTMLAPQGFYDSIRLKWTKQLDLRWLDHYEIQVSSDNSAWYSLREDGVDWKGTLNAVTTTVEATYRHDNIPFAGTSGNPTGVTLYYRVRQVTIAGTIGAWCAGSTGSSSPIQGEDKIAAGSIVGGNIAGTTITGDKIAANTITSDKIDVVSLFAEEITVPAGGSQRWYDGQGVQRRCIEQKDGRLSFFDAPDTTPPSPEVLRGVFGRLGVGPAVLMGGDFEANIESSWSAESVVNAEASGESNLIKLSDNSTRLVYRRNADGYLCQRVDTGSGYGAESVIVASNCNSPNQVQLADGSIRLAYLRHSDKYLFYRVDSGTGYGAETVINPAACYYPNQTQLDTGSIIVTYIRDGDNYICQRVDTGSGYGAESVIVTTSYFYPNQIQLFNKTVRLIYTRAGDHYLCQRVDSGTGYGAETVINPAETNLATQAQTINGDVIVTYTRSSDGYVCQRVDYGYGYGAETVVIPELAYYTVQLQTSDGSYNLIYTRASDSFIVERTLRHYARVGAGIIRRGGGDTVGHYKINGDGSMEAWFTDTVGRFTTAQAGTIYYGAQEYELPYVFSSIESIEPTMQYRTDIVWPLMGQRISLSTIIVYFASTVLGGGGYPGYHVIGRAWD